MDGRRIPRVCYVFMLILCISWSAADGGVFEEKPGQQDVWIMQRATGLVKSAIEMIQANSTMSPVSTVTMSPPDNSTTPAYLGFICAGVAVVFFGSNFVPVKKFETGDGMFFQWILCAAIWLTGLVVHAIQNFPTFYPLAMLGGFLWGTGNVTVVPIIKTIGLGMGILIWGTFNLLAGWASSRFGLFGLKPAVLHNPVLNYVGVSFAVVSAFIYMLVKSEVSGTVIIEENIPGEQEKLIPNNVNSDEGAEVVINEGTFFDRLSPMKKRIFGISLSIVSGILYGLNFTPVIYIQENYPGASQNALDYVFSHFCGILGTSSFYFVIYCIVKKNNPSVYPRVVLPGLASGVMWAIADVSWFIANKALSEAVSFPIITTGPGIVASLWGVLVFREIKGKRNILVLLLAFAITITGTILTAFSM